MKKLTYLLWVGTAAILCCCAAQAQTYTNSTSNATLIYSNFFGGGAVDITGQAPTYINPSAPTYGGSLTATFDVVSNNVAGGWYGYQNGTLGAKLNSVLLPLVPVSGYVYTLSFNLTYTVTPPAGGWGGFGFCTHTLPVGFVTDQRISVLGGNPWTLLNLGSASGGALLEANNASQGGAVNLMTALNTPYTINLILDTTGAKWIVYEYINGTFVQKFAYTTNPALQSFGYTQTTTTANAFQWGPIEVFASPLVMTIPPASAGVAAGAAFTNTVAVAATNTMYHWYYNSVSNYVGATALTDNGRIVGSGTNSLVFTNVLTSDGGYYFVMTTSAHGGSYTSSVASLTVYTNPVFLSVSPVAFTNPITLFGGGNVAGTNYSGSSPTFSVSTIGTLPLTYHWQTNGVTVGSATTASFTFTNCQMTSPTSFACIASNSYGMTTNNWSVSYVAAPTAPFPSQVLAYQPIGYWRLNEAEFDNNGDDGILALDYGSGNNGIYTNVYLGNNGYTTGNDPNNTDPTETSVQFGPGPDSDAFGVQGLNFAAPTNTTVNFSVGAWVNNGISSVPSGAGIVAKGYGGGGEQFVLNVASGVYQFYVRDAGGVQHTATATVGPVNNNWQYVVGVCDETHGTVSIYVNGVSLGSASVPTGGGLQTSSLPMSIGARSSSAIVGHNDLQYKGFVNDVTAFNYALTVAQVQNLYVAAGYNLGFNVIQSPPPSFVYLTGGTMTLSALVNGQTPIGYYWTNLTAGGTIVSGTTNVQGANLIANLVISNTPASLNGDQVELVITNALYSTNWIVALSTPAAPIQLGYTNAILYSNVFNGGTYSIAGLPLTAANLLVGGTNTTWNVVSNNPSGGYAAYANGTLAANLNNVLLPFTPHAGYVYTLDASLTFTVTPPAGGWGGLGFATLFPTNYVVDPRILNQGWALLNLGANGGGALLNANGASQGGTANLMTALNTPYDIKIILDATAPQWSVALYVAGTFVTNYVYTTGNPTNIASFGYGQTTTTAGAYQWNSITLTQVASNAPPYLLTSLPGSVTLGANTPLSIPAAGFSSYAPYGYYWGNTNTSAGLGSGTTNNVAPLPANLSVATVPGSWNGNTLALVLTNAYGTNISLVLLNVTNAVFIPTNQPWGTGFSIVGNNLLFTATNGQSGATYYLLGTTNLTVPRNQWLPVATNVILTSGPANTFTFTGTNVVNLTIPQQFYILSGTN